MSSHIYVIHGDLSQLSADLVTLSISALFGGDGKLFDAFSAAYPGFGEAYAELGRRRRGHAQAGETHHIPLAGDRPAGVLVTVSVDGRDHLEAARLAVRGALIKSKEVLTPPGRAPSKAAPLNPGRRLVALPTFLVGSGGGHHKRLQLARVQLEAARDVLAELELPWLDVVFVAYTQPLFHVFLEARRQVVKPAAAPGPAIPPQLLESLRARECVLFVGSGVSNGAGLPSWNALIERLEKAIGIKTPANVRRGLDEYMDIAQWYRESCEEEPSLPRLEQIIVELFGSEQRGCRPTLAHYLLMSLPLQYVVTTNYDDLIERTLSAQRVSLVRRVVTEADVAGSAPQEGISVVKLHGDAVALERGQSDEIVLSREDYETFFERRPALAMLLQGLLLNRTFLFVGYSLRDSNFRQIYHRISAMLQRAKRQAFATTLGTNALMERHWERKGLRVASFGGTDAASIDAMSRWFDALLDQATDTSRRVLAPGDSAEQRALEPLLTSLRRVGNALEALPRTALSPEDARIAARALQFLTTLGWTPGPGASIAALLSELAARLPDPADKRRLLATAIAETDDWSVAQQLKAQLEALG